MGNNTKLKLLLLVLVGFAPLVIANYTIVSDTNTLVRHADDFNADCQPDPGSWTAWGNAVIAYQHPALDSVPTATVISYTFLPTDADNDSWREFETRFQIPNVACGVNTAILTIASDDAERVFVNNIMEGDTGTVYGPEALHSCYACPLHTYDVASQIQGVVGNQKLNIIVRNYNTSDPPWGCFPGCSPDLNPTSTNYRLDVTFNNDAQAPAVAITSPTNGATYTLGAVPPLAYSVVDNCDNIPNVVITGYSTDAGTHTLSITATDGSGNTNTASITYVVNRLQLSPPPSTSICVTKDLKGGGSLASNTEDKVRHAEELDAQEVPDTASWTAWGNAVIATTIQPSWPQIIPTIDWISDSWNNTEDYHRNTWREFTKCFDTCAVQSATLKITGDDAFQVKINGVDVATVDEVTGPATWGPYPADTTWLNIYTFDVKNFLHDGVNLLDILVRNYDLDKPDDPTLTANPTGMTYQLEITINDTTAPTITVYAPQDGATYVYGFVPLPVYNATDNCDSNVTASQMGYSGAVGTHTMVVTAIDSHGNTATRSVVYTVGTPPSAGTVNVICPQTPPYPPCCISREWWEGGWIYLVMMGIATLLLFFALVYMLSKIFSKPEWVVWIKDEFYQTIISAVMVVFLVFVLSAICEVFITLAGNDPFNIAHTYLNGLVWDQTINLATRAFQDSVICQMVAGYKRQIGPASLGITFNQAQGLRAIATNFDVLYAIFAGLSASLMIQDIGLSIIQAFAFRIMLPLGILFRVFPFLRKAGAMLIAMALGLYIVYPLCFVMNKMVVDSVMSQIRLGLILDPAQLVTYVEPFILVILSPFMPWAIADLFLLIHEAAFLVPQAVFLPTLNLVITLTFIKNATRVLSQNFTE